MKNGDTLVVVYFDNMTPVPVCPVIKAFRNCDVAFQKPSAVVVYDYYDNSKLFLEKKFLIKFNPGFLFQLVVVAPSMKYQIFRFVTSA